MSVESINITHSLGLSETQTPEVPGFHLPGQEKEALHPVIADKKSAKDQISVSEEARAEKEKAQIEELRQIEQQVEQHEAAHQAAAGQYFRGKSFTYKIGPDGRRYIVGGEVQVDTSAVPGNPKATIAKMERIRSAALAPGDPSPQDVKVAENASRAKAEAEKELVSKSAFQVNLPKTEIKTNTIDTFGINQKHAASLASVNENESSGLQQSFRMSISVPISSLFGSSRLASNEGRYVDLTV